MVETGTVQESWTSSWGEAPGEERRDWQKSPEGEGLCRGTYPEIYPRSCQPEVVLQGNKAPAPCHAFLHLLLGFWVDLTGGSWKTLQGRPQVCAEKGREHTWRGRPGISSPVVEAKQKVQG